MNTQRLFSILPILKKERRAVVLILLNLFVFLGRDLITGLLTKISIENLVLMPKIYTLQNHSQLMIRYDDSLVYLVVLFILLLIDLFYLLSKTQLFDHFPDKYKLVLILFNIIIIPIFFSSLDIASSDIAYSFIHTSETDISNYKAIVKSIYFILYFSIFVLGFMLYIFYKNTLYVLIKNKKFPTQTSFISLNMVLLLSFIVFAHIVNLNQHYNKKWLREYFTFATFHSVSDKYRVYCTNRNNRELSIGEQVFIAAYNSKEDTFTHIQVKDENGAKSIDEVNKQCGR
ncbi:hypothetical protein [Lonepinella sp. BR2474]|uniref:hypothetical protein n=1 Tax=Lonepinella sp. BR2474 TaxID=3434548 RepID=UPI003F6DED95